MINKIVLHTVTLIFLAIIVYICFINWHSEATSQFVVRNDGSLIIVNTWLLLLITYIFGKVSGILCSLNIGVKYREQLEFFVRKTEKLSQQNEIDTDDKEALQRKIASLEIALDKALKNKSN